MTESFVVKRLTPTEIDADTSNQHEIQAGRIRTGLDLPRDKTTAGLTVEYYADGQDAEVETGWYTISNVRKGKPRSAEYHIYYSSAVLETLAEPNDLLLLVRPGVELDLTAIVAAQGSRAEAAILDAVFQGQPPDLTEFRVVEAAAPEPAVTSSLVNTLTVPAASPYRAAHHPLCASAITVGALPSIAEMCAAADELAREVHGPHPDADTYVAGALDAETELYYAISNVIFQRGLDELIAAGARYPQIAKYVSDRNQGAKTRRGDSLENHFHTVLHDRDLAHTFQCETEGGETADFVFPGCVEYRDPAFEAPRLRMVGCKSTLKDRWRQVLNEGRRVTTKFVLTLDRRLTSPLVRNVVDAQLRIFIPAPIIHERYEGRDFRPELHTVDDLMVELETAAATPPAV